MNAYQYVSVNVKLAYLKKRGFRAAPLNRKKTILINNYIHVDVEQLHELSMEQVKRLVWLAVKKFKFNHSNETFENEFFAVKKIDVMNPNTDVIDSYKKHIRNNIKKDLMIN